jgi:diguanylate cyclase (GGDEF)-like protein/PAS domain S-box-containing protein
MTAPVLTVRAELSIGEAAAQFKQHRVRHFVVVDRDDRPLGLVSQSDVVLNHGVEWFMRLQRVSSVLTGTPPLVDADAPLSRATALMRSERHDALAIDTGEGDYAILTERDILRHIAAGGGDDPSLDVATRPMQTVVDGDSLFHARNTMLAGAFRHLGVVDARGRLIGLIGFAEIMQTIEHGYVEELELALRERDLELRQSEERYRALVEASPDAIAVHRDHRILFINPAGARLLGARDVTELIGRSFRGFLADTPGEASANRLALLERELCSQPVEERFVRADGKTIDVELRAMPIRYNAEPAWQVVMSDITRRKEVEAELRRLASTDQLTGICNRPHFEQHLDRELRSSQRYGGPLALIMFDLNRFKRVNDTHGHEAGDEALTRVVEIVAGQLRDTDLFARWGGDEFMILCPQTTADGAETLCGKLADALRDQACARTGPIGAAFAFTEYAEGEQRRGLLRRLDAGVYRAKETPHDGLSGIVRA